MMKDISEIMFRYLYGIFTGGLIVWFYYSWFIHPVFTSLPSINYWRAIGLSSFLYLFNKIKPIDLDAAKKAREHNLVIYSSWAIPWVVLGMGFVTHLIINYFNK